MREADLHDRAHAAGVLADGTPITAGELRRLLCDAELVPVVLGGVSEILDLGRGRRLASAAQRRAIALRDGRCAFPGCHVPIHRCELHHIAPWQDGGPTDLDNLVALCVRHHQLCEPAPPVTDQNGYARAPDQWVIRARDGHQSRIRTAHRPEDRRPARVGHRTDRAAPCPLPVRRPGPRRSRVRFGTADRMNRVHDPWALSAEEPDVGEVPPRRPTGCVRCRPVCVSVRPLCTLAAYRPKD